jgi:hypothetical protein
MEIKNYAKVIFVGFVGGAIGLGAASLSAQSSSGANSSTSLVVDRDGRVWHAHGGRVRYCIASSGINSRPLCSEAR